MDLKELEGSYGDKNKKGTGHSMLWPVPNITLKQNF